MVIQLKQEVARPKARFKPTLTKKSSLDGVAVRCHIPWPVSTYICQFMDQFLSKFEDLKVTFTTQTPEVILSWVCRIERSSAKLRCLL